MYAVRIPWHTCACVYMFVYNVYIYIHPIHGSLGSSPKMSTSPSSQQFLSARRNLFCWSSLLGTSQHGAQCDATFHAVKWPFFMWLLMVEQKNMWAKTSSLYFRRLLHLLSKIMTLQVRRPSETWSFYLMEQCFCASQSSKMRPLTCRVSQYPRNLAAEGGPNLALLPSWSDLSFNWYFSDWWHNRPQPSCGMFPV